MSTSAESGTMMNEYAPRRVEVPTFPNASLMVASLAAGAWIGLKFPDIDQSTGLLLHRSIVTHGPIAPLALYLVAQNARHLSVRLFTMYLCLGFVVHMAFDLFPAGWSGYALISIPLYGWLPGWVSIMWLTGSVFLCAYLAARLVRGLLQAALLAVGTVGLFIVAAPGERALIGPLLVVAASLGVGSAVSISKGTQE